MAAHFPVHHQIKYKNDNPFTHSYNEPLTLKNTQQHETLSLSIYRLD